MLNKKGIQLVSDNSKPLKVTTIEEAVEDVFQSIRARRGSRSDAAMKSAISMALWNLGFDQLHQERAKIHETVQYLVAD